MKQKSSGLEGARGNVEGRKSQKEVIVCRCGFMYIGGEGGRIGPQRDNEAYMMVAYPIVVSSLQSLFQLSESEWADEETAEEKVVPVCCAHSDLPLHIAWSHLSACVRE